MQTVLYIGSPGVHFRANFSVRKKIQHEQETDKVGRCREGRFEMAANIDEPNFLITTMTFTAQFDQERIVIGLSQYRLHYPSSSRFTARYQGRAAVNRRNGGWKTGLEACRGGAGVKSRA